MTVKKIPVSEFKAHCAEELRAIENGECVVEITRHGKVIAIAQAPQPEIKKTTLLGAGKDNASITADYDPHEPALDEDDWNINQ